LSRKILVILTIGMFLGIASFSAIGVKQSLNSKISCLFGSKFATNLGGDRLDQQQPECNKGLLILGHTTEGKPGKITNRVVFGFAQTFMPDIHAKEITRVSLYVAKVKDPPSDLKVGIGRFKHGEEWKPLWGPNDVEKLFETYTTVSSSKLSTSYRWVEFDFPDIKINRSCTYYIFVSTTSGHAEFGSEEYYTLGYFGERNLYEKGKLGKIQVHGTISLPNRFKLFPDSDLTFKTYAKMENKAPGKPTIDGPTKGKKGETYSYIAKAKDPEGDKIYYFFDWGDGTNTGWLGPYPSNQPVSAHHTWYGTGKYSIRVKAKDDFGEDDYGNIGESEWSDPLIVAISKNKKVLNHVFLKDLSLIKQLLSITRLVR